MKTENENKNKRHFRHNEIIIAVLSCFLIVAAAVWLITTVSFPSGKTENAGNDTLVIDIADNKNAPEDNGNEALPEETETVIPPTSATLIAVGDDVVHAGVYNAGLKSDGTHDYSCLFDGISSYISDADIKVINQETILGGDELGLSSYPLFNSPQGIGDAIAGAGFNVVLHASNHAMDMGLNGLTNCLEFWKTNYPDITVLGIYESEEEQDEIPLIEVNDITIALLNYSYSHNSDYFTASAEGHLNMLCAYDPDTRKIDFDTINPKVLEDIEKAEEIADFTIVFPHWGTEYVTGTTKQQTTFAKQMTQAGADLIIGTHPHVIEPVEWVESENDNESLCYYSLGNFTSTQDSVVTLLGGMASLTIVKDETGTYIDPSSVKAVPLVTHYTFPGYTGYSVVDTTYLLRDYTEELAASHGLKNRRGIAVTLDELTGTAQKIFGEFYSPD